MTKLKFKWHNIIKILKYKLMLFLLCSVFDALYKKGLGSWEARAIVYHEIDEMLTLRSYKQQNKKARIIWHNFTKTSD
jgi:hypothetical protein